MSSPVTFVLVAVPPNLRHALTRWLIEPAPGVFVGTISARVRAELWKLITTETLDGWSLMIHTAQNEQGFQIHTTGRDRRMITNWDGLQLVTTDSLLENIEEPF